MQFGNNFFGGVDMYIYSHNDNKNKNGIKLFFTVLLTVFFTVIIIENVIILVGNERQNYIGERLASNKKYNINTQTTSFSNANNLAQVIESVKDSTVGVSMLKPTGENMLDVNVAEKWGTGTGIIVTRTGYVLTNQHLAQNVGAKLVVTLNDGKTTQGKVIWNEPSIDLAIIKVDEKNLKPATLGSSSNVYVGDDVIAIGNPLGVEFQGTTTKGIISGVNRAFTFKENEQEFFMSGLIQTDASINPGNSGGPLINDAGEVIGVNTIKLSEAEGIGFAVPINIVKPIIEKLEKNDSFEEAYLGVYALDKEMIPYMDSKIKFETGIYLTQVDKYGPSGKAGLKVGDIIASIDNIEIDKMIELREYIYSKNPGETVTLKVIDGEEKEVKVVLGKK